MEIGNKEVTSNKVYHNIQYIISEDKTGEIENFGKKQR